MRPVDTRTGRRGDPSAGLVEASQASTPLLQGARELMLIATSRPNGRGSRRTFRRSAGEGWNKRWLEPSYARSRTGHATGTKSESGQQTWET